MNECSMDGMSGLPPSCTADHNQILPKGCLSCLEMVFVGNVGAVWGCWPRNCRTTPLPKSREMGLLRPASFAMQRARGACTLDFCIRCQGVQRSLPFMTPA